MWPMEDSTTYPGPEQAGDRLGLGRRFHDDQGLRPAPGALAPEGTVVGVEVVWRRLRQVRGRHGCGHRVNGGTRPCQPGPEPFGVAQER